MRLTDLTLKELWRRKSQLVTAVKKEGKQGGCCPTSSGKDCG